MGWVEKNRRDEVVYIWEIIYSWTEGARDLPEKEQGTQMKKSLQSQGNPLMDEEGT